MLQKRNTQKTNGRVLAAVLGLFAILVVSVGCGGGGGGGGNGGGGGGGNESATVAIAWPAQSRIVNAPSSADSARISLLNNSVSVASLVVNRPVATGANTQNYTLNNVPVGNFTLNITFFAEQNAPSNGTVVGTASKSVTIVTGANDLGNVTVVGTADSLSIPSGQTVGTGSTAQLVASALDNGVPIPVADGAFTWSIIAGGGNATISGAGVISGISAGTVTVQAVLDNGETNLSATQTVTVTTGGGGSGGGGGTWVPANKIFYTAVPDNDPTQIAIRHVDPNTEVVTDFLTLPINVVAAAPNPSVANQLIFAYTTNPGPSATYAFYKNTSLTTVGASKITNEVVNAFETVGTIQVTPDGSRILFTAAIGTDFAMYIMNSDGANLRRIDDADDANLSPDGTKIVYSKLEGGDANIWVIGINDLSGTVIYNSDSDDIEPQWNKAGTKIAFASLQAADLPTSNFDIYTILPDGEQLTRVTATEDDERSPTWGPDGRVGYLLIALASDIELNGIYVTTDGQVPPTNQIVSDPSVSAPLYWTNNQGRALEAGWGQRSRNLRVPTYRKKR